jgi:chitinase
LKARQPHLKIVFGVGGWKYTGGSATPDAMSAIVSDPALRQQFVQSCVSLWRGESDLCDGLDLDWEHPKGSDRTGLTQLLVELRQALDRERRGLLLSVSVRCDVLSGYDAPVIRDSLDFVNAMTYLLGPRTSYNAPLTSGGDPLILKTVVSQMQLAEAAGFPKDKLLLGVQAYAHGGTGVGSTNNGLHQPASGGLSNRKIPYREAVQRYVSPSFTRYWNAAVPAAHFYSASEQMFVNVQSPEEVLAKAQYVQAQGYGGLMLWTLDADVLSGASSLIQTAGGVLTP